MSAAETSRTVSILMATFDGAAHLAAQLDSLEAQRGADWRLWVGDDGSTDGTGAVLTDWSVRHPGRIVAVSDGPGQGSAANFLALLIRPDLPEGPVAFCDQDDIWRADHLARGLAALSRAGAEPALYASATTLLVPDGQGGWRDGAVASRHPRPPGFRNALVQNILSGNTMVMNGPAQRLLRQATARIATAGLRVPHHDWWAYLVVTGAGGRVTLDPEPGLSYRQHGGNLLGTGQGIAARIARARRLAQGELGDWIGANLAALRACEDLLTPAARADLAALAALRQRRGVPAVTAFLRSGLYRQRRIDAFALGWAALSGRL